MSRLRFDALGLLLSLCLSYPAIAADAVDGKPEVSKTLIVFHTMFGVDGPFVGDENPVDEIPGDELPWEIATAIGNLDTSGRLVLVVRGLVFKDDPSVPPGLRGINDEEQFRAAVSCLSEDGDDETVVRRTVVSPGFPASVQGDSTIMTRLDLPDPCLAPTVFVLAGSEDKWFAVIGFESEEAK